MTAQTKQQWYCQVAGKVYGPVSSSTLQEWAQTQRVSRDDLVRRKDGDWMALGSLQGIKWPAGATTPPPVIGSNPPAVEITTTTARRARSKLAKTPTDWWAVFDWRFEYYLTPWIIRVLWVGLLVFTALALLGHTFGFISGFFPETGTSEVDHGRHFSAPQEPAISVPGWFTAGLGRFLLYALGFVSCIVSTLLARMFLELMIVVFRIAEDIGTLRRKLAEQA